MVRALEAGTIQPLRSAEQWARYAGGGDFYPLPLHQSIHLPRLYPGPLHSRVRECIYSFGLQPTAEAALAKVERDLRGEGRHRDREEWERQFQAGEFIPLPIHRRVTVQELKGP